MAEIENRGPRLVAVASTLLSFAITATLLRCYVRIGIVRAFGLDDYLMVFALISFILFCTSAIVGVYYGTGRHYWDLEEHDQQEALMYWYLCYIWYCLTMIASKISIGYFLLRITIQRMHKWIIYLVMFLTVVTGLVFFFVTMLQCIPVSYFWDKVSQSGQCINIEVIIALTYLYSAFSVICDFTFAFLPIVLIMQLQMNRRTKVALIPIMLMACVASAAVVVRFIYVKDFKNPDFLYATVDIAIWSTTEQGLAITAGSLATLRPLFRKLATKLGWSAGRSGVGPTGEDTPSGSLGKHDLSGRHKRRIRGPFSLATFTRHEDEYEETSGREEGQLKLGDGYPGNFENKVTTSNRQSLWTSKRPATDNESEEELRIEGSKNDMKAVKIKSFLITEEHA